MKLFFLLLYLVIFPLTISAQSVKISNRQVRDVIDNMELYSVKLIEVKTLKKWKALELSRDMKPQMNYNVVRVKYRTLDTYKTVLIDMHLVPILYDSKRIVVDRERKNSDVTLSYSNHN